MRDIHDEMLVNLADASLRPSQDRFDSYVRHPFDPNWWIDCRAIDHRLLRDCQVAGSNRVYRPYSTTLFGYPIDLDAHPYDYNIPEMFEMVDSHTPGCTYRSCRRVLVFV